MRSPNRMNTVDEALQVAGILFRQVKQESKTRRIYRVFVSLTGNHFEALVAFSIWTARGQTREQLESTV